MHHGPLIESFQGCSMRAQWRMDRHRYPLITNGRRTFPTYTQRHRSFHHLHTYACFSNYLQTTYSAHGLHGEKNTFNANVQCIKLEIMPCIHKYNTFNGGSTVVVRLVCLDEDVKVLAHRCGISHLTTSN